METKQQVEVTNPMLLCFGLFAVMTSENQSCIFEFDLRYPIFVPMYDPQSYSGRFGLLSIADPKYRARTDVFSGFILINWRFIGKSS